jgi:hypothetical protein
VPTGHSAQPRQTCPPIDADPTTGNCVTFPRKPLAFRWRLSNIVGRPHSLPECTMDDVRRVLNSLLDLVFRLGDIIVTGIIAIEFWLRSQLGLLGVPAPFQTIILIALAVVLIVLALRLFGGLIRIAIILILALIAIHILMPVLHH